MTKPRDLPPWWVQIWLAAVLLVSNQGGAQESPFAGLPVVGDAAAGGAGKFSFAILGDRTSGGEGQWPIFDRAVDAINLLDPDFVITVGDQIPGHMQDRAAWDAEWAEYLQHARRLEMPLLLIPGNHDIANVECYRFWTADFGPTYYAFDYQGCHFLIINTEEERFDGRGPIWQAMLAFVEDDLARHMDSRHTFVLFHKPMWDDPRYEQDWQQIERALGRRKYTVVAGHEHYLMTERRDGNLYVLQSATGAGIQPCSAKLYGAFHSFGYVTVDGDTSTYAVVEPEGGVWPVDVAPACFRQAIANEIVRLDAERSIDPLAATATVHASARLHNVLADKIMVSATVGSLKSCGWTPVVSEDGNAELVGGDLLFTQTLEPGQRVDRSLVFRVPRARLAFPPRVTWRINYRGHWIQNESYRMRQEDVIPIYPVACLQVVPEWLLVGPFPIGEIDTHHLPDDPAAANPRLLQRFGPEDGYDAQRGYEGGRRWFSARSQGRGLLNFNALMGTLDHALGYALCDVQSPQEQLVHAVVCSDNYAQVILNGSLVEQGQDFGVPGGYVYVPLHLKAGTNTLIVKLINNHGDWFLRVLIADPNANLRFARPAQVTSP